MIGPSGARWNLARIDSQLHILPRIARSLDERGAGKTLLGIIKCVPQWSCNLTTVSPVFSIPVTLHRPTILISSHSPGRWPGWLIWAHACPLLPRTRRCKRCLPRSHLHQDETGAESPCTLQQSSQDFGLPCLYMARKLFVRRSRSCLYHLNPRSNPFLLVFEVFSGFKCFRCFFYGF